MRLAILTSVETRHRYVANCLRRAFDVAAVAYEETGYCPAEAADGSLSERERRIVADHFAERARQELAFFGQDAEAVADGRCRVCPLRVGELNSARTAAGLEEAAPDVVVVYGTNLIREPLLSRWAGRMVNLHLGLSPYYRGTGTNFYPLLNEEPEYVGATIHLIDPGIDSGPILRHACPEIVADDRPHTIGCKAIQAAVCALVDVLRHFDAARARAVPQWQPAHARLYRRKDYHPRQVVELYRKLDEGLIPRYLAEQEERRARVRLVR